MWNCLWFAIEVCECENKCDKYVSINSDEGFNLIQLWGDKIDEVLKPVRKEFAKQNGFKGEE